MTFNSPEMIIQDIRAKVETLLVYVTGEDAYTATADQIERGLFRQLLELGAQLLTLFFANRAAACSRDVVHWAEGIELPYHRDSKRDYLSIFGKIALWRPYFYKQGVGSCSPLDAELGLGEGCYSDLVRELQEGLIVQNVYQQVSRWLERLLGLTLSTRVGHTCVAQDAAEVNAYYAQKPAPLPAEEGPILVIQADGKGVPMILEDEQEDQRVRLGKGEKRGHKKEALVTAVYTVAARPRTAAEVVASLYRHQTAPQPQEALAHPQHKQLRATLDGKEVALERLALVVQQREGPHIQHRAALSDGCEALQTRLLAHFPTFVLILDLIHANEYLWDTANCLWGESAAQRLPWMEAHTQLLLSSQAEAVIAELRALAAQETTTATQREQLCKTANYFERNLPYMDYATYLAQGLPIASGVIEGACRHFVKDRCERSGMRWSQTGAEDLLQLRAVAENGDWEDYHDFRRRQRHQRLYQTAYPAATPEQCALAA